jgi:hypothetical protein
MIDNIQVTWAIHTFDRRLKGPFPLPIKHYVLDWTKASESEQLEIIKILGISDGPDKQKPKGLGARSETLSVGIRPDERMLRFRQMFIEKPIEEIKRLTSDARKPFRTFKNFCLPDYFEDETGREITIREILQIKEGNENVIPFDAENIAQLGPCAMNATETWTVDTANTLFNFIQIVRLIGCSRWARKKATITVHSSVNNSDQKLESNFPDVDSVCAVLTLFRQLYAKSDKVMESACTVYIEHCGAEIKKAWVNRCLQSFNKNLDESPDLSEIKGCTIKQLFEAFLYGTGIVHSIGPRTKDNLKGLSELVRQHGREKVIFAVHESFWMTAKYAFDVCRVVERDYAYWTETQEFAKADMLDIFTLLGSTVQL